jgi:hypothetical protein
MGSWNGIFIILGCAVGGLLLGFIIIFLFLRIRKKSVSLSQKDAGLFKIKQPESPSTTTLNNGIIKSNRQEDALEILIKNHKNSTVLEDQRQSSGTDVHKIPEIINQKSTPIVVKPEKLPQQDTIHWTELYKHHNMTPIEEQNENYKPLTAQEPATLNQKNTLVVGENKNPPVLSISKSAEITNQKTTPVEERQKKTLKSNTIKRPEINNQKNTKVAREQKKSFKPSSPQEPEVIKQKNAPVVEDHKQSVESGIQVVPVTLNQKNTPVVEKPKESSKSDFLKELETNLAIATTSWADKLIPFQTSCWDAKHGEGDPLLTTYHQELIQLYVDIGLANNIVWLATEIGHRSSDLDDSYIKLCASIADSLKRVIPS